MIRPRLLRLLQVDPGLHPRRQRHVSSASGLVITGRHACLVADDENHLVVFECGTIATGALGFVRLAEGALPEDAGARKRLKRDLETLLWVPASPVAPGLLVALGSGSTPQRDFAYVLELDATGCPQGNARRLSLQLLYDSIRAELGEINIEAGFVQDGILTLVHRAHAGAPINAAVRVALPDASWLARDSFAEQAALDIIPLDLGELDGVPLGITDAARCPDGGWVFSAVAEDVTNSYDDGACIGSVLGKFDRDGGLARRCRIEGTLKVEGVAFATDTELWLATDADDPAQPSAIYSAEWR